MFLDSPTLVHHFLENSACHYADKTALVHGDIRASYSEINRRANSLAACLLQLGVQHGGRIVILFENSLDYVVSYYGVLKIGAVAVPLNTDQKPDSLKCILREIEPRCIIAASRLESVLKNTNLNDFQVKDLILSKPQLSWTKSSFRVLSLENLLTDGVPPNPSFAIDPNSLACIIYTSGSTGLPKGVMLSHTNIVSNSASICSYLKLTSADIQMVILPFRYVMGKSLLNTHFAVGGSVVINNKFAFPASVLNEMVAEEVSGFSGVPSTYAYLLHRSPLSSYREKLGSLRYCSQAGGHMSRRVKEELRRILPPQVDIFIMYGATEASGRLSYLQPKHYAEKMNSIGQAIPGVALRVLDAKGQELPPGKVGELVAAGPNIMRGYWKDPESTRTVLDKNGYHTGDQAYRDEEGYLYVTGRRDNLIKVGGHRINPCEIEDILMESSIVMEVVVLGVPDRLLGNKLVALAVPTKDCDPGEIVAYCARRLPRYKCPNEVKWLRLLPKNASGKIDRSKCLELFTSHKP